MKRFVRTKDFQDLNVGAALDEGMASPTDEFALFYGERCVWRKFMLYSKIEIRNIFRLENSLFRNTWTWIFAST
jgi:hypothetical protein